MSNSEQLESSTIINDGESVTVNEVTIAPTGELAVDISGNDAQLTINSSGAILAEDEGNTAVQSSGEDVNLINEGTIFGDFNGVDSSGDSFSLANGGIVASNSRAVQIDGEGATINNSGSIIGIDNQRNGTIYADDTANNYTINNSGLIDAGEGNNGAGISLSLGDEPINATVNNTGLIQGRTADGEPLPQLVLKLEMVYVLKEFVVSIQKAG